MPWIFLTEIVGELIKYLTKAYRIEIPKHDANMCYAGLSKRCEFHSIRRSDIFSQT